MNFNTPYQMYLKWFKNAGFQHVDLTKVVIINRNDRWKGSWKGIVETSHRLTRVIKFEFNNPETPLWQMDGVELRGFCFAAPSNTVTQKFGLFENMLVKI